MLYYCHSLNFNKKKFSLISIKQVKCYTLVPVTAVGTYVPAFRQEGLLHVSPAVVAFDEQAVRRQVAVTPGGPILL